MKPHQVREMVNELRDTAVIYSDTAQLRERISHIVHKHLAEPQAEKQKPVAYMDDKGYICNHTTNPERWTPLYTAPPQREWVGLTDEEIAFEWRIASHATPKTPAWSSHIRLARAIEAKLKEKNYVG